ncbi:MAG: MBL fold metallo-hydrolase [Bacteroidota bacterium]
MEEKLMYLKPNVVIEPLVDKWYAWPHLISPASAAMNITGRHIKIMNSYIQAPQIHAAAVQNPKMKGGPFMDFGGKRVDEVKELRDLTMEERSNMIAFSDAVKELEQMLREHAKGYSLEPLYEKIPDMLKGYVELYYDLNNNASYRFFESLLYKSEFYEPKSQSIAMWVTDNDERPFTLSTPKLKDQDILHLPLDFKSELIDEMSQMRRKAGSVNSLIDRLELSEAEAELFRTFFTEEPLQPYSKYEGDKVRMRYFGHACILIETKNVSILADPVISYYGYQSDVSRFSDIDLPEVIDYVLITHNHQDHILFETLLPLRHKIKNLVIPKSAGKTLQDPSLKLMFDQIGFENIIEIDEMESLKFGDVTLTGVPFVGEHSDLNIQAKICYHIRAEEFTMLFVADSCNVEQRLYEHVRKEIGAVDVIFLGMECDGAPLSWLYGPLFSEEIERDKDQSRRLAGSNYERGMALVNAFSPSEVYVYAMGQEPWLEFISSIKYTDESNPIIASNNLIDTCNQQGILSERLFGEKEILYSKFKELVPEA